MRQETGRDHLLQSTTSQYHAIGFILSIIVLVGLGYVFGGVAGRYVARLVNRFEHAIQDVPGYQLMFGTFGIITGFIVALFPSVISVIIFRSYIGWILATFLFVICGTAGYIIAVQKKDDLLEVFRPRGAPLFNLKGGEAEANGKLLDTSVIIDGRVVDICASGFLDGTLIVARFILNELQNVADSADALKRNRGRRGLDILNSLQRQDRIDITIEDRDFPRSGKWTPS